MWADVHGLADGAAIDPARLISAPKNLETRSGVHINRRLFEPENAADLAALGIVPVVADDPPPAGQEISSSAYQWTGGQAIETHTFADLDLAEFKARVIADINAHREAVKAAGLTWSYLGADHPVETDARSREAINGLVTMLPVAPSLTETWRMADNSDVALDAAAIAALGGAVLAHGSAAHATARAHKDAVAALSTAAEVAAYDWSTGWPATL